MALSKQRTEIKNTLRINSLYTEQVTSIYLCEFEFNRIITFEC